MSSMSIGAGSPRLSRRPARRSAIRPAVTRTVRSRPVATRPVTAIPVASGTEAGRSAIPGRTQVRLTARGRLVAAILVLTVVLAAFAVLRAPASAAPRQGATVAERVTVTSGQTLWQIARRAVPDADPRATIVRIQAMNGLSSSTLRVGQVLLVPAHS